jgi:hypothetical protein
MADPVAYHRSAVSLVAHGSTMLKRFCALQAKRQGYILGALSDAETVETARLVAACGIPVVKVEGSGHNFSHDAPTAFARSLLELLN